MVIISSKRDNIIYVNDKFQTYRFFTQKSMKKFVVNCEIISRTGSDMTIPSAIHSMNECESDKEAEGIMSKVIDLILSGKDVIDFSNLY